MRRHSLLLSIGTLALVIGGSFLASRGAFAQVDTGLQQIGQTIHLSAQDPRVIAANIINALLGLVGIVLLGLLIYAGFLYMTAGGEEAKVEKAKKIIQSSIIGLIIVLSSWAIARYVIEKLLQATGGGGGGTSNQGGGGGGGGFGGSGGSGAFQVKSISPQQAVPIRNVQVKLLFTRAVDDKTATAIVVTKNGAGNVGGTLSVNDAVVTFTPTETCPTPHQDLHCFEADSDYTVQIGPSLRSLQGQAIACGGFAPACTATFHTGALVDVQAPTVSMVEPQDGQAVPADSLIALGAHAEDDGGVSYVEFHDSAQMIDQVGPAASSSPLSFLAEAMWDTAGLVLQSTHTLSATVHDLDAHDAQSTPIHVVIRSPSCFNAVKDGDETGVDCGGTPNTPGFCGLCSGGSCSQNDACASGTCQQGTCVAQPVITSVSPQDGQAGTFVTLRGSNFGSSGNVVFLGGPGPTDDRAAQIPQSCIQAGITTWSPSEVVIAVPTGAANGPLKLTNTDSGLADETNDGHGPVLQEFVVNDSVYPGLCALQPAQGYAGDQVKLVGRGFGSQPSSVTFGSSNLTSFVSWTDQEITANVPVLGTGKQSVRVNAGSQTTNSLDFQILNKTTAGAPVIQTINPAQGPEGEYVTLTGVYFGSSVGTVKFKNKTTDQEALGDVSFPQACSQNFWSTTNVIIKVPSVFIVDGSHIIPGDYRVTLTRADNVTSNGVDFTVTTGSPKPGICAIEPSVGPIATPITIYGEHFGSDTGDIVFYNNNKAAIGNPWADTEIKSSVPVGAVTGPVHISTQGAASNNALFQVRNCNEDANICSAGQQCCANGTCTAVGQTCAPLQLSAMYAWQSSTGLIPVSPAVVEECAPGVPQAPIPSPSPWINRQGGDRVCVNANAVMRFTAHLEPGTVSNATFKLKKCTSQGSDPCATSQDVTLPKGPVLKPASLTQDMVELEPSGDLEPDTTYLVQVTTAVKGLGAGGAFMSEHPGCGAGMGYCYRFKTRSGNNPCTLGSVSVAPHPYELHEVGSTVAYTAAPLASEDACVMLKCSTYDWNWTNGGDNRAVFKAPLQTDPQTGKVSCEQTGMAMLETGDVPVPMSAVATPGNIKGTAHLYVKFVPPKVVEYGPGCNAACINALVWARFSGDIDSSSIAGNVEVRACANENCLLPELGAPLPIPLNEIVLMSPPKTSDPSQTFLSISPVITGPLPGQKTSLLVPGKYYRVLLKGGTDAGIKGKNGVPLSGLNDAAGFVWTFRTKLGEEAFCKAETVDVSPLEKIETEVGARQLFRATASGKPDECSAAGQLLVQTEDVSWNTSDPFVADFFFGGTLDTGGALPPRCSSTCQALGAEAQAGKAARCGNGSIETTDEAYCVSGKTPYGDACTLLPDTNAGEECDPGIAADVGLCEPTTCLWKPIVQVPVGTCGNAVIDKGEACDFGRFCQGASPTSTTPDGTNCTSGVDKAACEANGGSCAPRQYRGCSSFCRHTGSTSAKSTCGNGDIADGEDCDDGNMSSQDGCTNECLHGGSSATLDSVCGNGILEPGETCEKPGVNASFPSKCDQKTCLHQGDLACDNDPATPNVNCCGNATVDAGEDCDDGNKQGGDGCSVQCLLEGSSIRYARPSFCSNGVVETGEQCDAGLPSNHQLLLQIPTNAIPKAPVGSPSGDSLVDDTQLAMIVGEGEPDAHGLMSSQIAATLESQTGKASYGLQCGFSSEKSCKPGYGLTDKGCCELRPVLKDAYPQGSSVCRNAEIKVVFDTPMDVASVSGNIQIAKDYTNGNTCPPGTVEVADGSHPAARGFWMVLKQTWRRVLAWITGDAAFAAQGLWCQGSVAGTLVPLIPDGAKNGATTFVFKLNAALEPKTTYRVKFLGDTSLPSPNELSDNDVLANRKGIKTINGVAAPYDASSESGPFTWTFQTGTQVCGLNLVQVKDVSENHPLLFIKDHETHPFVATAMSVQNSVAVPIVPVPEYSWKWLPWVSSKPDVVEINTPVSPPDTHASVEAKNNNGNAFVSARVQIDSDTLNVPSSVSSTIQGAVPVQVLLCENPWPNLNAAPRAPFRDISPLVDPDSSVQNSLFQNGPFYNFSTLYCRDDGKKGMDDDLPKLNINFVPPTAADKKDGILRQYLFTFSEPELKKDGIGIRIVSNPLHYSPEDWYAWRGFTGTPQSVTVDGYRALRDGATTYVAAANTANPGENIYSNIYLISHNPDAAAVTVGIYDQLIQNLVFNINLTTGSSNICETVTNHAPILDVQGKPIACSSDYDCVRYGQTASCASFKQKLVRDTTRIADFARMSRAIEGASQSGVYPALTAGTYLEGFTTSRWPSWDQEFSSVLGNQQPKDPLNQFLSCGRCSDSQAMCGTDADCPADQTCNGITLGNATYAPQTCWSAQKSQYLCPTYGPSPSRLYQYRSLNGGKRYELATELEVPKPSGSPANWWTPPLLEEVKRCVGAGSQTEGYLCDVDADCRPCVNPKDAASCPTADYPVTAGACKTVGGRFIYQGMCKNVPYGQGGTCGDGVLGKACSGGSNNGNSCSSDNDCAGGSCTSAEVCEIGQTKLADCTVNVNGTPTPGLKLQTCSECKEFVDEPGVSTCEAGVQCGNGRVDKQCSGGTRDSLSCLTSVDCPGTPAGVCGPTTEVCDDGVLNGSYGHCNVSCTGYASFCGDGMLSPGEVCDNGAQNGSYCSGGACASTCSLDCKGPGPMCGDGHIDAPHEMCDGGSETTALGLCTSGPNLDHPCTTNAECGVGGTCANSCQGVSKNRCATSLKQCGKAGETVNGPTYASQILTRTVCQQDADCAGKPEGTICRPVKDMVVDCTNDNQCSYPGISGTCQAYPTVHIRTCNANDPNACTFSPWSACQVTSFCGDGKIDAPAEACDDGAQNGDTKACTSTCKKNVCGDGKPYAGVEECDAGAQNGQVTCSADYNSSCSSCSNQCKFLSSAGGYCGDGVKNGPEQCDGMTAVSGIADQYPACPYTGSLASLCDYLNADCMQSPCQKTKEPNVTCPALGYDFSLNGTEPKMQTSSSTLNQVLDLPCNELDGMKGYEFEMFQDCAGLSCTKKPVCGAQQGACPLTWTVSHANPMPSANDFWACVRQKGPPKGITIQTSNVPSIIACSNTCSFNGCGKCSDSVGSGTIGGQLVDAVYNQPVPFAKVSLFYKGVLVTASSTDADGKFQIFNLNDRGECSQYKMVVDKYDDNPCTGGGQNRPSCGGSSFPAWQAANGQVNEGDRGGYWPLTTPFFSVSSFEDTVIPQGDGRILLFPRPGTGEGYMTVMWGEDWSSNGVIKGGNTNHLIIPEAYAYTAPNDTDMSNVNFPASFTPTTCLYASRPTALRQCVRDVTWKKSLLGMKDLSKLPNAYAMCLHSAGEKTGGYVNNALNGCPVEGSAACIQNGGDPDECQVNNPQCTSSKWETCDFYSKGPLTTYFRYSAFTGSQEPLHLYWGRWSKSIAGGALSVHSVLNPDNDYLKAFLNSKKFKVVASTDKEIISLDGAGVSSGTCQGKDCKFWKIADLDPSTGIFSPLNVLEGAVNASTIGRPDGIANAEYNFQGGGVAANYCVKNSSKMCYGGSNAGQSCSTNADCPGNPTGGTCGPSVVYRGCSTVADCKKADSTPIPGVTCEPIDYQVWSQLNF